MGAAPGTSTAPSRWRARHRADRALGDQGRRRRRTRCCCTSAGSWTWTRRSAEYWPEFKARGKERVLVRHVLNHRAGLPVLDRPLTPQEALDPQRGAEAVAAQAPVWEPGTDHGYHALTYGWMLDELVRRVTGQWAGEWIAAEIAGPLALICGWGCRSRRRPPGRAGSAGSRRPSPPPAGLRARPKRRSPRPTTTRTPSRAGAPSPRSPRSPTRTTPPTGRPPCPPTNGIATADGLARFYAALIGEVDGAARLFTPATVDWPAHRGVGGPRPRPGRQHPLRPRLHAARQRVPVARPGLLRPPGPRRRPRLRRPGDGHRLRLCDERLPQDGDGGPAGAGAGAAALAAGCSRR